ncbi:MAG: phytoene/squalene synthase family protein [Planctomycetia bacterium]|nr:phytoene/squalene synthase family protein [Planctomycetia bacterium]
MSTKNFSGFQKEEIICSYHFCEKMARKSRSSFYAAFSFLPPQQKQSMEAIYAFMRFSDDLADMPVSDFTKKFFIERWESDFLRYFEARNTSEAREDLSVKDLGIIGGEAVYSEDFEDNQKFYDYYKQNILPALMDTIFHYEIPLKYFQDVMSGIKMDVAYPVFKNSGELETYCYHVASAVGLICLYVWGVEKSQLDPGAENSLRRAALACGKALQWTNILRDVVEDAKNGRVYLPEEDLKENGFTPDTFRAEVLLLQEKISQKHIRYFMKRQNFVELKNVNQLQNICLAGIYRVLEKNLEHAKYFYEEAEPLLEYLPRESQKICAMILGVYYRYYLKIKKNPWRIFMEKVHLNVWEKLQLYVKISWRY